MHDSEETLETQVAIMVNATATLNKTLDSLTQELRKTNETVQVLHSDQRVMKMEVERNARELFTPDQASRIRTLELHIRGLYTLSAFIAAAIGGELFALLSHWSAVLGAAGGHR